MIKKLTVSVKIQCDACGEEDKMILLDPNCSNKSITTLIKRELPYWGVYTDIKLCPLCNDLYETV